MGNTLVAETVKETLEDELNGTSQWMEEGDEMETSVVAAASVFGRVLAIASPLASIMVLFSPVPTMHQIITEKTTKEMSVLPYLCLGMTEALWAVYGILIQELSVSVPYIFGTLAALFFTVVFHNYSPKKDHFRNYCYYLCVLLALAGLGGVVSLHWDDIEQRVLVIGYIALGSYFAFLVSPLCVLLHVVNTKNVESLPFGLSFAVFIECDLWLLYSVLVQEDIFVTTSSVCGVLFTITQLGCHVLYGDFFASLKSLLCPCFITRNLSETESKGDMEMSKTTVCSCSWVKALFRVQRKQTIT